MTICIIHRMNILLHFRAQIQQQIPKNPILSITLWLLSNLKHFHISSSVEIRIHLYQNSAVPESLLLQNTCKTPSDDVLLPEIFLCNHSMSHGMYVHLSIHIKKDSNISRREQQSIFWAIGWALLILSKLVGAQYHIW